MEPPRRPCEKTAFERIRAKNGQRFITVMKYNSENPYSDPKKSNLNRSFDLRLKDPSFHKLAKRPRTPPPDPIGVTYPKPVEPVPFSGPNLDPTTKDPTIHKTVNGLVEPPPEPNRVIDPKPSKPASSLNRDLDTELKVPTIHKLVNRLVAEHHRVIDPKPSKPASSLNRDLDPELKVPTIHKLVNRLVAEHHRVIDPKPSKPASPLNLNFDPKLKDSSIHQAAPRAPPPDPTGLISSKPVKPVPFSGGNFNLKTMDRLVHHPPGLNRLIDPEPFKPASSLNRNFDPKLKDSSIHQAAPRAPSPDAIGVIYPKPVEPVPFSGGHLHLTPIHKTVDRLVESPQKPNRVIEPKPSQPGPSSSPDLDPKRKDPTFHNVMKEPPPEPVQMMDPVQVEPAQSSSDLLENKRNKQIPATSSNVPWTLDALVQDMLNSGKRNNSSGSSQEKSPDPGEHLDASRISGNVIPEDPGLGERQSLLDSLNRRKAESQDSVSKPESVSNRAAGEFRVPSANFGYYRSGSFGNMRNSQWNRNNSSFESPNLGKFYHSDSGNGSSEERKPSLSRDYAKSAHPGTEKRTFDDMNSSFSRNRSVTKDINPGLPNPTRPGNTSHKNRKTLNDMHRPVSSNPSTLKSSTSARTVNHGISRKDSDFNIFENSSYETKKTANDLSPPFSTIGAPNSATVNLEERRPVSGGISSFSRHDSIRKASNHGLSDLNISGNGSYENRRTVNDVNITSVSSTPLSLKTPTSANNDGVLSFSRHDSVHKNPNSGMSDFNIFNDTNSSSPRIVSHENRTVSTVMLPLSLRNPQPSEFHPNKSENILYEEKNTTNNSFDSDRHNNPKIFHPKPIRTEQTCNPAIVWSNIPVDVVKKPKISTDLNPDLPNIPEIDILSKNRKQDDVSMDVQESCQDLTITGPIIDPNAPENVPISASPALTDLTQVDNQLYGDSQFFTDPDSGKIYANLDKSSNLDDLGRIQLVKPSESEKFGLQEPIWNQIPLSIDNEDSQGSNSSFIFDHGYYARSQYSNYGHYGDQLKMPQSNDNFQHAQNRVWSTHGDQSLDYTNMSESNAQRGVLTQGHMLENAGNLHCGQGNVESIRGEPLYDDPKRDYLNMAQFIAPRDIPTQDDMDIVNSQHSRRSKVGPLYDDSKRDYLNLSQSNAPRDIPTQDDMDIVNSQHSRRSNVGPLYDDPKRDYLNLSQSNAPRDISTQDDMDIVNSQHSRRSKVGPLYDDPKRDYLNMAQFIAPRDIPTQDDMDIVNSQHSRRSKVGPLYDDPKRDYLNLSQSNAPRDISTQDDMDIVNSQHSRRSKVGPLYDDPKRDYLNMAQFIAPRDIPTQDDMDIVNSQHSRRSKVGPLYDDPKRDYLNLSQSNAPRDISTQDDMDIVNSQHSRRSKVGPLYDDPKRDYLDMSQFIARRDCSTQEDISIGDSQHAQKNMGSLHGVQRRDCPTMSQSNTQKEIACQKALFENFYQANLLNDRHNYSCSVDRDVSFQDEGLKSRLMMVYNLRSQIRKRDGTSVRNRDSFRSGQRVNEKADDQRKRSTATKKLMFRVHLSQKACKLLLSNKLLDQILCANFETCKRTKRTNAAPKPKRSLRVFKRDGFKIFKLDRIRKKVPRRVQLSFDQLYQDLSMKNEANFDAYSLRSVRTEESFESDDDDVPGDPLERLSQVDKKLRIELDEILRMKSLLPTQPYNEDPEEDVKVKIQNLLLRIYDDLQSGRAPVLNYKMTEIKNCVLRDDMLQFKVDAATSKVDTCSVKSHKPFTVAVYVLKAIVDLLDNGIKLCQREVYYMLKHLLKNYEEYRRALQIICMTLNVGMWSLNIFTQKGLVYGNMKLVLSDGENVNCNVPGTLIPMDVNDIVEIHCKAAFILVVEKAAIFHKLIEEGLPDKLTRPFVLITGKGFPDQSTQRFLRKIWMIMSVPVFILVDADPHGIGIMMHYRFGSVNNAHVSHHLAVPGATWLGVFPSEIEKYEAIAQNLTATEERYVETLLRFPNLANHPRLLRELMVLRNTKVKAGIEGLLKSDVFLSEVYLPTKFYSRDFI